MVKLKVKHLKSVFLTSSDLPKPDFSGMLDPFDTPAFNKLYRGTPQFVYT